MLNVLLLLTCFFFNDTATTEIYTLSLHDALPILGYDATPFNQILKQNAKREMRLRLGKVTVADVLAAQPVTTKRRRSEERFSRNAETDLVCRLLLEKKKGATRALRPSATR